jgi:hypothetical protein
MPAGIDMGLRTGILCNGTTFQRWQADAIRHVMAVPGVELVVLVMDAREEGPAYQRMDRLFYRKFRQHFFKPAAMELVDMRTELAALPVLRCLPRINKRRESFEPEDLAAIGQYRPDVLLRFGFNILEGDILDLPTHGIWSFHHGDETRFRGGPPGFWEIMKNSPITGALLQRITRDLDAGMILRKGWFATIDHSLKETVDTVLGHTAVWPAQVMREILMGRPDAGRGIPSKGGGKLYTYPDNLTFTRFLAKQFRNKLRFHQRELKEHEEWNIGVLYQPVSSLLEENVSTNVRWLPTPAPDNFRADPFGYVAPDGTLNVLYEKYDHKTARGEISRVRPRKDNVLKRSRTMLSSEDHLSYPYVVQRPDGIYVIPENAGSGVVRLYKLSGDNDALEPLGVLLDEPLYDPTLFEHEGRWWMFGTLAPLTNVALQIYYSDTFEGPYRPHVLNPVKFDIRSSRPAGTPFIHDGQLWRPAQDSSRTYGGRIAFNRILELTPETFREETVRYFGPVMGSTYDKGLHTVVQVGDVTLIDGKRFVTVKQRKAMVKKRKLDKLKRMSGA